jgi:hypothetical protein
LYQLLEVIRAHCRAGGCEIPEPLWSDLSLKLRREFSRQRVYVPPPDSRKDPARTQALRDSVSRLPTGVAAAKHGVSTSWARQVANKRKNRDT